VGCLTTGGFGGADIVLGDANSGTLSIATAPVKAEVRVADVGREDIVLGSAAVSGADAAVQASR